MGQPEKEQQPKYKIAEAVRQACVEAAREGFREASMSGLCTEGAIEAAIGSIQSLNLEKPIKEMSCDKP